MGITQGQTLLSSLNLSSVGATSHGQHDLGHVSRRLAPSAEEGYWLRLGLEENRLNLEAQYHRHALDAEKALQHGLFLPSADVSP